MVMRMDGGPGSLPERIPDAGEIPLRMRRVFRWGVPAERDFWIARNAGYRRGRMRPPLIDLPCFFCGSVIRARMAYECYCTGCAPVRRRLWRNMRRRMESGTGAKKTGRRTEQERREAKRMRARERYRRMGPREREAVRARERERCRSRTPAERARISERRRAWYRGLDPAARDALRARSRERYHERKRVLSGGFKA